MMQKNVKFEDKYSVSQYSSVTIPSKILETLELLNNKYYALYDTSDESGYYQKKLIVILFFVCLISHVNMLILPIHKELPEYKCINKSNFFEGINKNNTEQYLDSFNDYEIISDNNQYIRKYCEILDKNFTNPENYIIKVDLKSSINFITELGKMCEYDEFFVSINLFGYICRSVLFLYIGTYADTKGRLPAYYLVLFLTFISHFSYYVYKSDFTAYLNIGLGMGCHQIYYNSGIIGCEFVSTLLASIHCSLQAISCAAAGLLMLFIIIWTHYVNNIILFSWISTILITLFSLNFMFESPNFLINQHKYNELEIMSEEIAIYNSREDEFKIALKDLKKFKSTCPPQIFSGIKMNI